MPFSTLWDQTAALADRPLARRAWEQGLHPETIEHLLSEGAVTPSALRGALSIALNRLEVEGWDAFVDRLSALGDSSDREAALALAALRQGDGARGAALARRAVLRAAGEGAPFALALCVAAGHAQAELARWTDASWFVVEGRRLLAVVDEETFELRRWDLAALALQVEWHTSSGMDEYRRLELELRRLRARNLLDERHAAALVAVGDVDFRRGELAVGAESIARALHHLPAGSARSVAALAELALIRIRQGRWREGYAVAARLPALVDGSTPARIRAIVTVTSTLEPALSLRFPEALGLWQLARQEVDEHWSVLGDTIAAYVHWITLFALGDFVGVVDFTDDLAALPYRGLASVQEQLATRAAALANLQYVHRYRDVVQRWATVPGSLELPFYWTHRAILADIDGDRAGSREYFEAADELLDALEDPMGRIWTRLAWGLTRMRRGEPSEGLALWELAREEMRRMGAVPFAELLTTVLQQVSAGIAGATGDPLAVLTEQQRRIAELVADGYTSAEIAQRLFLSKRTVDFHVANAVTRLGLGHRREIKRLLDQRAAG